MPLTLGTKTVTTAGTRVQLTATATPFSSVVIQALATNTGDIYVGDSTVTSTLCIEVGIPVTTSTPPALSISAGDELNISDLSEIYLDAAVSGEGVNYFYVVR